MEQIKRSKTTYSIAKGFISFFMLPSAYITYTQAEGIRKLVFPDYFR